MAVVDNNILSSLAKADRLNLLRALFDTPCTTPEVLHEFRDERVAGFPFVEAIEQIHTYGKPTPARWLAVAVPTESERERMEELLGHGLAPADAECLSVAAERDEVLVTDDQYLGRVAKGSGVDVLDLETILLAAAYQGVIEGIEAGRDLLARLRERDFYAFSQGFQEDFLDALERSVPS